MSIFDLLLIGLGLSMDAAAVSIANVLGRPGMGRGQQLRMAGAFGLFQGFMPLLGFFAGSFFADFISRYAGIVTLLVLGLIGGSMLREGLCRKEESADGAPLTFRLLMVQALATSIDAFAVGVSFCAVGADIFYAAPIIAVTTFVCSLAAAALGKQFGPLLGDRAQLAGGIILLAIGIKAVI